MSAVDAAGLGFYELEVDSGAVSADQRIQEMFGLPPDAKATARDYWLKHIHPEYVPDIQRKHREMLEGKSSHGEGEYRYEHPSRGTLWFRHMSRVQTRDASGRPARLLGVVQDITERKRSELEIQRQRNELAHLSRVNMLGELAGSLAHELNQPLTVILSNAEAAEMLLESDAPDLTEIRKIQHDIVLADRRAVEIIQRLRRMLKKEELSRQPLEINDTVLEAIAMVSSDLVDHGLAVELALGDGLPLVLGDRVHIEQVLINLLSNACDAMSGNAPQDRKLVVRTDAHDGEVRIAVIDSGSGIPADMLEKIFDSFVTTKAGGMGLGLSICRGIIADHQGRILAGNNPGRGAYFRVMLPALVGR